MWNQCFCKYILLNEKFFFWTFFYGHPVYFWSNFGPTLDKNYADFANNFHIFRNYSIWNAKFVQKIILAQNKACSTYLYKNVNVKNWTELLNWKHQIFNENCYFHKTLAKEVVNDGTQLKITKIIFYMYWVENVTRPGIEIWIS